MLQHKGTTIVSKIKDFFTSSEKAISTLFLVMTSLIIFVYVENMFLLCVVSKFLGYIVA
jgi:hypothetical protein